MGEKKRGRKKMKFYSKEDVLRSMEHTSSCAAAARYLGCSYPHFKMYANLYVDAETGKTLFELHKNQKGVGISKATYKFDPKMRDKRIEKLLDVLEGRVSHYNFKPETLKRKILEEGILPEQCNVCSHRETRVQDGKMPLILHHKDNNKRNFSISNIEFLCFNCSFLYAISPLTEANVRAQESYLDTHDREYDWEISRATLKHFQELGLVEEEGPSSGSEFIARSPGV